MKRIIFVIALLTILILPSYAYAGVNNTGSRSAQMQAKIEARQTKLLAIQERKQDKTASREAKLFQLRQKLILKYYQQMSKRLWAMINRLEILISRIDARIVIVDAETDKNLDTVKADVAKAKTDLVSAKDSLTLADGSINTAILSIDNPKEAFALVKSDITNVKNNLKEVHKLLVHVIGDLEGLRVGATKLTPTAKP